MKRPILGQKLIWYCFAQGLSSKKALKLTREVNNSNFLLKPHTIKKHQEIRANR